MQTIIVELLNKDALALLQQLEQLNILRLVESDLPASIPKQKWAGRLSKETGKNMLAQLDQSRREWKRNI